ncbi:MAG: cytochrome c family protein [Micavibrio sp.]|nr:cytochrome c family protein [Micavibrio sp.]|tara:strand:- start:176 stop:721 length:546 start_codon:yes stop_codon:yes gene_type:complete
MNEMEFNKIFAAILVAGIIAMLAGFIAEQFTHGEHLEEDAYVIEVADAPAGGHGEDAPKGPEPINAMLASANIDKGAALSKACAACHDFTKGGPNRVGPGLWNVVNRDIGSHEGFAYSAELSEAEGNWTYDNLNAFLYKPKEAHPGTKMNFIGLKKTQDRADLIAWLRTLSDSPAALPAGE